MKYRQLRSIVVAAASAVLALGAAAAMPASAQQQPVPVVVGVIDAQGILEDSKAGQSIKAQAEKTQAKIKSDFDKQEKQFNDDLRKLQQQKDTLSTEDLQKKREELRQRADQQSKALKDRQRKLEADLAKGQDRIVRAMVDVVKDVAKAHGLTLVISRAVTPYFDASYDISTEVKQKLDAKLPSLSLQQSSASDAQQ